MAEDKDGAFSETEEERDRRHMTMIWVCKSCLDKLGLPPFSKTSSLMMCDVCLKKDMQALHYAVEMNV